MIGISLENLEWVVASEVKPEGSLLTVKSEWDQREDNSCYF